MRVITGNRQIKRYDVHSRNVAKPAKPKTCAHGWEVPQELVTLTITDRKTGLKQFRQVWRDVENAGCPQGF
jgi:hypothetical protein